MSELNKHDELKNLDKINNQEEANQQDEINNQDEIKNDVKSKGRMVDSIKTSFTTKKFKGGAYATAISVIVLVMVLVVNIMVSELDLKIDLSSNQLYTLTKETKNYVKGIEDDVTIYYLAASGGEDATISEIIEKYDSLSSHITVEYKDPVLYPQFAAEYVEDTVSDNSVLVVNNVNGKAKYIDNYDMYEYEVDYTTYQSYATSFDAEGQVTSALQYVTTEDLPVMYMIEGHGEIAVSTTLASSLAKVNVTTNTLATSTAESIPEDCSILLINAPESDYTEDEVTIIKDYLAAGGDAIMLVDYMSSGLVNFNSIINYYGVSLAEGMIIEGSTSNYIGQYVNNLVPNIDSHDITSSIKADKTTVVVPNGTGIQILDSARSTITIEPLMTTSDKAFSKVNLNSTNVAKEDGDIDGPFYIGVAITETYNEAETKLAIYGSPYIIEEDVMGYYPANLDLFINTVNYVSDQDKGSSLVIPSRSNVQEYITLNAAQVNFWGAVVVIVIPVLILAYGGFVCIRRRKR